ncbi:ketosteroid isomerase-like protein [Corynebacterium mustelae]|uniref:Ketosteroid isomerase-like protein n=1 Tax=Corynebacterium mustelae TaxID=571915 RepID=A0A0G3GZ00_9CORY|nr:nuclear transport factor 2 family protein [Corynebacterium mustelae]AKK05740.1 ketosteroid isomerase-like protein [Corynebacterium mustelae]
MSQQSHQPRLIVEEYFAALANGRIADALSFLDPQVRWHQPGNNQFSGSYVGVDNVVAHIQKMMEFSQGTLTVQPTDVPMVNEQVVAVPVRFTGTRVTDAGETIEMDQSGIDLLTVNGGRIVEVRLFSQDNAAEDRFLG